MQRGVALVQVHVVGVEPMEGIADGDAAPTHVADVKVGAVEQATVTQRFHNHLERARFGDSRRVAPDVVEAAQAVDAFDSMPGVEAARRMRQDQAQVRVRFTVAADGGLVDGIGQGAVAHHVQGDSQPFLVGDAHVILDEIGFDGRVPGGTVHRGHGVVGLEADEAVAPHFTAHEFGVHVGRDDHLPAAMGIGAHFFGDEAVVAVTVAVEDKPKEEAADGAPARVEPFHKRAVFGDAQLRRRAVQVRRLCARRVVVKTKKMGVGVENEIRQEGNDRSF